MHDFALRNPDDIKKQLDDYADVMCETLYNFRRLEEHKKILLAQLSINEKTVINCSMAEAEKRAMCTKEYNTHIEGYCQAEKEYSKAKSKYANLQSWVDLYRSWLVTNRELSR
jgi:hypothetical protein